MFANQIEQALSTANLKQIDVIMAAVWRGYATGSVAENDAQKFADLAEVRRIAIRGSRNIPVGASAHPIADTTSRPPLPRHLFPARRQQRSPDRARSMARRRNLSRAGVLPNALAERFTNGELAVLAIIAADAGCTRQCDASIAEIAARAGVQRTTVQNAVRLARDLGLITMIERRRPGRPSETNLIRIISAEWKQWIKRGGKRPESGVQAERAYWKHRGFKKTDRTDNPTGIIKRTTDNKRSKRPFGPPMAVA